MRPHIPRQILRWPAILPGALTAGPDNRPRILAPRAQAPDREPLGIGEAVVRLFPPGAACLFVQTASGLMRSDDGGTTWRAVDLPPQGPYQSRIVVAVDPNDHTYLSFADGAEGVDLSMDDGIIREPLALPAQYRSSRPQHRRQSGPPRGSLYVMRAEEPHDAERPGSCAATMAVRPGTCIRRDNAGPGPRLRRCLLPAPCLGP